MIFARYRCLALIPFAIFAASGLALAVHAEPAPPNGDATIRAPAGGSEIVITTTARCAGAIHSLTWNGMEFIDSWDHGRQLQSASNFDHGTPIADETFNPTEAGSLDDGPGPKTSSRLLSLRAEGNVLETATQMAFWLAPGERSGGQPAKNSTVLSRHVLKKRVQIGYSHFQNVLKHDVSYQIPDGEIHRHVVFEALTGYMPQVFSKMLTFCLAEGSLAPLSDGPGEIEQPVVFSTPDGTHAMAIYAPPQPAPHTAGPTYGRFRFEQEKVVKWNCVFRVENEAGLAPGEYAFRMFVVVGDVATVTESLRALHREFAGR